jgi:DNA-binding NarL/FixJ family response regulator
MNPVDRLIRVLLADDHPVFRAGLRATLDDESDMVIVGEATTAAETVELCRELQPDVLLLDLRMPGPPAEETVALVHSRQATIRIVVVSAFDDALRLRDLVLRGIVGYVLKDEPPSALVEAVRAVMRDGAWFSAAMTQQPASSRSAQLTDRDREMLLLLSIGLKTAEISKRLHLGEQTTRNYLSHLYSRINVPNRAAAVAWARERGVI